MMKKKKYFCVLLVAALTSLLATCVDENDPPGSESPDGIISVDEAKAFFEEQMMRIGEARDDNELQGLATEFTPLWSKAVISGKDSMVAVDVPITANSLFWAILPSKSDSTAMKSAVHMPQKLVVVKNRKTGNKGTYIVSLIPDRKMRISAMDFTNYGDYGNFSGRITYSLPLSAVPLRVDCFKEGRLTNAASIFGLKDRPEEIQIVADKIAELLSGVGLMRKVQVGLRSSKVEYIYGGELPEVVVTPGKGGGNSNGNNMNDILNLLSFLDNINNDDGNNPPILIDPGMGGGIASGAGRNTNQNSATAPKKIAYTASQFKNTGGYIKGSCNCMCMAQKIMKQILGNTATIGSSANVMQLWKEVNGVFTKVGNANDVFNTLNDHINANRPIIVGVEHTPLKHPGNSDKTTDHFIVINGRGYDDSKGQYYYNYVETGRTANNGAGATSDSNRLYYDSSSGTFNTDEGAASGKKTYSLTQIRPNNN